MPCKTIDVSQHAFLRAIERNIDLTEAVSIMKTGEVIMRYPEDVPYPSRLMLGFTGNPRKTH